MFSIIFLLVTIFYGVYAFYCIFNISEYMPFLLQGAFISYIIFLPILLILYYLMVKLIAYFIVDLKKELLKMENSSDKNSSNHITI